MSQIYEELMETFTKHLIDVHGSTISAWELHDEQIIMEDFLENTPLSPRIRQEICCPMGDCKWVQHFTIQYQIILEAYEGEQ